MSTSEVEASSSVQEEESIEENPFDEFLVEIPALITVCEEILEDRVDKKPVTEVQLDFMSKDEDPEAEILETAGRRLNRFKDLYMKCVTKGVNPSFHKTAVDHFIGKVGHINVVCGLDGEWLKSDVMFQHHADKVLSNGKKAYTDVFIGQFYIWAKKLDKTQKTKLCPRLMHHFYKVLSIGTVGQISEQLDLLSKSRAKEAGIALRYNAGGDGIVDQIMDVFGDDEELSGMMQQINGMQVRELLTNLKSDGKVYGIFKGMARSAFSGEQDVSKLTEHLNGLVPAGAQKHIQNTLTNTMSYMENVKETD